MLCVLIVLLVFAPTVNVHGADVHVSTSGDDTTGDGTLALPYQTIEHSLDQALSGDTIRIHTGLYMENLFIDTRNNLTIEPFGDGDVTISGAIKELTQTGQGNWTFVSNEIGTAYGNSYAVWRYDYPVGFDHGAAGTSSNAYRLIQNSIADENDDLIWTYPGPNTFAERYIQDKNGRGAYFTLASIFYSPENPTDDPNDYILYVTGSKEALYIFNSTNILLRSVAGSRLKFKDGSRSVIRVQESSDINFDNIDIVGSSNSILMEQTQNSSFTNSFVDGKYSALWTFDNVKTCNEEYVGFTPVSGGCGVISSSTPGSIVTRSMENALFISNNVDDFTFVNNDLSNAHNGAVFIGSSDNPMIAENFISNVSDDAIEIDSSITNAEITKNHIYGASVALSGAAHLLGPTYVHGNTFVQDHLSNIGQSIKMVGASFLGGTTKSIHIYHNSFFRDDTPTATIPMLNMIGVGDYTCCGYDGTDGTTITDMSLFNNIYSTIGSHIVGSTALASNNVQHRSNLFHTANPASNSYTNWNSNPLPHTIYGSLADIVTAGAMPVTWTNNREGDPLYQGGPRTSRDYFILDPISPARVVNGMILEQIPATWPGATQYNLSWNCAGAIACIQPPNNPPTNIALDGGDADFVVENIISGSQISVLTTNDTDTGDTHIYTLTAGVGDEDNEKFTITDNGLNLAFIPDFENPEDLGDIAHNNTYAVRINVYDGTDNYQENFIVSVIDQNTVPTDIALTSNIQSENTSTNTFIGSLSSIDDGEDVVPTYTLNCQIPGVDDSHFNITGASLNNTTVFDFEAPVDTDADNTYAICIRVNDGIFSFDKNFTITVTDINESIITSPTVTPSFNPSTISTGSESMMTLTFGNPNAVVASLTNTFTDLLPSGIEIASIPNVSGSCTGAVTALPGGSSLRYARGSSVPTGGCTITVAVTGVGQGLHVNDILIGDLQSNLGDNTVATSANLVVNDRPTITPSFNPNIIIPSGITKLTLTFGNTNSIGLILSNTFTDLLPANLTIASPANIGGTCTGEVLALSGGSSLSYASGSSVPSGGCTIVLDVTGSISGTYINDILAGDLVTNLGDSVVTTSANLTIDNVSTIVDDEQNDTNVDVPTGTASITGWLWEDKDNDGARDKNEDGIDNVNVELTWLGSNIVSEQNVPQAESDDQKWEVKTNKNGKYEFKNLSAGEYVLEIDKDDKDLDDYNLIFDPGGNNNYRDAISLSNGQEYESSGDGFGFHKKDDNQAKLAKTGTNIVLWILLVSILFTLGFRRAGKTSSV